eukprot:COSAG06_NODE_22346_length_726_cov_1.350877_1_plen_92_part_00
MAEVVGGSYGALSEVSPRAGGVAYQPGPDGGDRVYQDLQKKTQENALLKYKLHEVSEALQLAMEKQRAGGEQEAAAALGGCRASAARGHAA